MEFFADKGLSWATEFQYALMGWVGWVNGVVDVLDLMHWADTLLLVVADGRIFIIMVTGFHLGITAVKSSRALSNTLSFSSLQSLKVSGD